MKKILLLAFLVVVLSACNGLEKPRNDTDSTAIVKARVTPTLTVPSALFEEFDASYNNTVTGNSKIVVVDEKIFYSSDGYVYCYDIKQMAKTVIDENPVFSSKDNIHLSNGLFTT